MGTPSIMLICITINILKIGKPIVVAHPVHVVYLTERPHPIHVEPRKPVLSIIAPTNIDVAITAMMLGAGTLTSFSCSTTTHAPEEHPRIRVIFQQRK